MNAPRKRGTPRRNGLGSGGCVLVALMISGTIQGAAQDPAPPRQSPETIRYNLALIRELEGKVRQVQITQRMKLVGPAAPDGGRLESPDTPSGGFLVTVPTPGALRTDVMGQIFVRDRYVERLTAFADDLEATLQSPDALSDLVRRLRRDAAAMDDAYQNTVGAERAVISARARNPRADPRQEYEQAIARADQLQEQGNTAAADRIRQQAAETGYGYFVTRRTAFFQALDRNPLLGLGERRAVFPDTFLFKALRNTLSHDAPHGEYVALVRPYLERALTEARAESARAAEVTTQAGLREFGGPKYERTREAAAAEARALHGSELARLLGETAQGEYEAHHGGQALETEFANLGLNLVAGGAWIIPVLGPLMSASATAIMVVRDGTELVVAVLDAEQARNVAPETGYTRIITAEDRVAAARGDLALAVGGLALEGINAVRVIQGPPSSMGASAAPNTGRPIIPAAGRSGTEVATRPTAPPVGPSGTEVIPRTAPPAAASDTGGATRTLPRAPAATPRSGNARSLSDAVAEARKARVRDRTINEILASGGTETSLIERLGREVQAARAAERGWARVLERNAREALNEIEDVARRAGVPEDEIASVRDAGGRTPEARANDLLQRALRRQGFDPGMTLEELIEIQGAYVRARAAGLTPRDIEALRGRVAADPQYFEALPRRGTFHLEDGFEPVLNAEAAAELRSLYDDAVRPAVAPAPPPAGPPPSRPAAAGAASGSAVTPSEARIIDKSTPVGYRVVDSSNEYMHAIGYVDANGQLIVSLRTRLETGERSAVLRGAEQFERILKHFEGRYTGIRGSWSFEDNLEGFNKAISGSTPPDAAVFEAAALETWTGQQAQKAGFTRATILETEGAAGEFTRVEVLFTRPVPGAVSPPTPHVPAPSGATRLGETPGSSLPVPPGPVGAATTPGSTSAMVIGGFVPATTIPPLHYSLAPVREETNAASAAVLDVVDLTTGLVDLAVTPPAGEDARDPTVQRMIVTFRLHAVPARRAAADRAGGLRAAGLPRLRRPAWDPVQGWRGRSSLSAAMFRNVNAGSAGQQSGSGGLAAGGSRMHIVLTSLGQSQGEAFTIQVLGDGSGPLELSADGLVVEPLTRAAQKQVQQQVAKLSGQSLLAATVNAYCLEFLRQPPSAGTIFRIAAPEIQQQYAQMRSILQAARRLEIVGLLQSDGGSVTDYVHSIRQWAVWAKERDLSRDGFRAAFVEHTRKNVEQAGHRWTPQLESALEKLVPHRWEQVTMILQEATAR